MLSQGWRKREAFKVLDNLYKFMVKGTVKKVREETKSTIKQRY